MSRDRFIRIKNTVGIFYAILYYNVILVSVRGLWRSVLKFEYQNFELPLRIPREFIRATYFGMVRERKFESRKCFRESLLVEIYKGNALSIIIVVGRWFTKSLEPYQTEQDVFNNVS